MRFVIDMNLAPRWEGEFRLNGHEALHWSKVGLPTASDREIIHWARDNQHIIFTHDLDFATALALTYAAGPSVIQVRTRHPLPEAIGAEVFRAVRDYSTELLRGALVTIDAARSRVRLLPLLGGD